MKREHISASGHHIEESAIDAIADLASRADKALCTPQHGTYQDAAPFVVLRDADGKERIEWLRERKEDPKRKFGTVPLYDAKSFIHYYKVHANGAPVYATLDPARFIAVLNDHTTVAAGWRDHRADFTVRSSREWKEWSAHNGAGAPFGSPEAFALFVEEHAPDIVKPDPATMLSIALNFRVKADVQFSAAQRLEDGNIEFGYSNVVQGSATGPGGGKVKIPEAFQLELPVWDGIDARRYKVDARFRYRLRDGKVTIWYELVRPHKIMERAFKDLWEEIQKETKAPILHGKPE